MIDVEIVGGPRDGEIIALPDGVNVLKIAMPTRIDRILLECDWPLPLTSRDPGYRQVTLLIVRKNNRWKAYWKEPT
jgi:hypothetical protein